MQLSYAQNMEDMHLQSLFPERTSGFYIDIGAGHVVADNVSFLFYEKGWRGIIVEPNAALAAAYRTVRPRDVLVQALCGAKIGEADFYEAESLHGLSTTVAAHAETAADRGVGLERKRLAMTTLAVLCERHAAPVIDFLKIDVEGAEADVIAGGDWTRFRPRVIVLEAVAPWSLADASASFAPMLDRAGYRFAFFDNLNRWYVAEESATLIERFPGQPLDWTRVRHLGEFGRAPEDVSHPDHALAQKLDSSLFPTINLRTAASLRNALPAGVDPSREETRAALARIAAMYDGGYVV